MVKGHPDYKLGVSPFELVETEESKNKVHTKFREVPAEFLETQSTICSVSSNQS